VKRTLSIVLTLASLIVLLLAPGASPALRKPMIAPLDACPGQSDLDAPVRAQERAMRCLTDYARRSIGLGSLGVPRQLDRSANGKSADILRCDSFSHFACGRDFTYWIKAYGYLAGRCWRAAENIARGVGERGAVRTIFSNWMHSPGHRRNILGSYRQIGVGLRIGDLEGRGATRVWTQHFGSRC
jgi:uncharacterized protein YkwD